MIGTSRKPADLEEIAGLLLMPHRYLWRRPRSPCPRCRPWSGCGRRPRLRIRR